jgi:hypothetical protein
VASVNQSPADSRGDSSHAILGLELAKNPHHLILDDLFRRSAAECDVTIVLPICDGLEDFQFLRRHAPHYAIARKAEKTEAETAVVLTGKKKRPAGARPCGLLLAVAYAFAGSADTARNASQLGLR